MSIDIIFDKDVVIKNNDIVIQDNTLDKIRKALLLYFNETHAILLERKNSIDFGIDYIKYTKYGLTSSSKQLLQSKIIETLSNINSVDYVSDVTFEQNNSEYIVYIKMKINNQNTTITYSI